MEGPLHSTRLLGGSSSLRIWSIFAVPKSEPTGGIAAFIRLQPWYHACLSSTVSGMILRFAKSRLLEHLEVERIASCVEWSWCGAQVQNVHVSGWELHTGYIHCGGTNSENDGQINSWFVPNSLPNMFCLSQGECKIGYSFVFVWLYMIWWYVYIYIHIIYMIYNDIYIYTYI